MLPDTPSVTQLSQVITQVTAPSARTTGRSAGFVPFKIRPMQCLSEGDLSHVARSITFRKTARWVPAKVPTSTPDHFSLAPFNAVGERG